jgi:hypothetical protein
LQATESAPKPTELAALGPGVADDLCAIAADDTLPPLARTRAIYALRAFPTPASRALLNHLAKTAATDYARTLAARSLAASGPQSLSR